MDQKFATHFLRMMLSCAYHPLQGSGKIVFGSLFIGENKKKNAKKGGVNQQDLQIFCILPGFFSQKSDRIH